MGLELNVDWATADPGEVLWQVRAADDAEIEAALAGDDRHAILRGVFGLMAGYVDPERAGGINGVLHFKVWDKPGGGYDHYEIVIADGAATLSETPQTEPTLTIKGRAADLLRVAVGEASPVKLAFKGRIRAIGDLGFGRKLPQLFAVPGN